MGAGIDLLGCEYLGGCPAIGTRILNKVELHFDDEGLVVAIAPQGLFTLAGSRRVLSLTWPEINVLSATNTRPGPAPLLPRLARSALKVCTMRLDLADQLAVGTTAWTMTVGVRVAADELAVALHDLRAGRDGPAPLTTSG